MTTTERALQEFNELIGQLKTKGFKVYTRKPKIYDVEPIRYGYIVREDGKFCYFQNNPVTGLDFSSCCIPSHEHGSGRIIEKTLNPPAKWDSDNTISKEFIDFAIDLNHGKKWPNFASFCDSEIRRFNFEYIER